jgi:drug/metabolite transporter (DMT)-like permease
MPNAKLLNYLHLHFIVFIWGFTAVLGALISIDALGLVWFRMSIASLLILAWVGYKKIPLTFSKKTMLVFLIAGAVIAMHWLAFFGAIKTANVSITLAIMSTGSFFTALLEPIFYKRKIIWYEVVFGLIVVLGLYVIFQVEGDYSWGIVLALISSFLGALFSVINGKLAVRYNASAISFYELFFGVCCISIYLFFSGSFDASFFTLSPSDWGYLFILASGCTAYAFIASVHVMKWISPYTVMLTINLEPVYGIVLALIILGESENMGPQFYYGAAIIILTVVANGIIKNRIKKKSKN